MTTDDQHEDQHEGSSPDYADPFWSRVRFILDKALTTLAEEEPADFAARVAYCREHGVHGISAVDVPGTNGTAVGFVWGGRPLVAVHRSVFDDAAYLDDLAFTWVNRGAPADLSSLDGDGV
jgi:hypothetical protein